MILGEESVPIEQDNYDGNSRLLGFPNDDDTIWETEETIPNTETYCKWCYTDGKFVYTSLGELTDFLVGHMSNENWPPEQARAFFEDQLPKLNYWKQQ